MPHLKYCSSRLHRREQGVWANFDILVFFTRDHFFYEIGIETLSVENCQSKDVKVFGDSKGILLVFIGERFGSRVLETINMLLKVVVRSDVSENEKCLIFGDLGNM